MSQIAHYGLVRVMFEPNGWFSVETFAQESDWQFAYRTNDLLKCAARVEQFLEAEHERR